MEKLIVMDSNEKRIVRGFMCDTGAGDALRYLHSMCEYLESTDSAAVIYCLRGIYKRCEQLIRHFSMRAGRGITAVAVNDDMKLHNALKNSGAELLFHPFDTTYLEALTPPYIFRFPCMEGLSAKATLMDRFDGGIHMNNCVRDHLVLYEKPHCNSNTLLVFVRELDRLPEMNLTPELLSTIIRAADKYGLNPVFTGSPLSDNLKNVLSGIEVHELYPNASWPDYYTQIVDISAYDVAIGINSGGLDMVEAAGVPLIRLCDFHWNRKEEGADFNRFLNSSITVNVRSRYEQVSDITDEKVMEAFSVMMSALQTSGRDCGGKIINI